MTCKGSLFCHAIADCSRYWDDRPSRTLGNENGLGELCGEAFIATPSLVFAFFPLLMMLGMAQMDPVGRPRDFIPDFTSFIGAFALKSGAKEAEAAPNGAAWGTRPWPFGIQISKRFGWGWDSRKGIVVESTVQQMPGGCLHASKSHLMDNRMQDMIGVL